ncbi:unnamed protein product [Cutaneotrichosporon oleaginosum]
MGGTDDLDGSVREGLSVDGKVGNDVTSQGCERQTADGGECVRTSVDGWMDANGAGEDEKEEEEEKDEDEDGDEYEDEGEDGEEEDSNDRDEWMENGRQPR